MLGDDDESWTYDALGRMTQAADDDSIVNFTYDSLSRVLTEEQGSNPLGSTGKTVTYAWNAENERTKITYPSGFEARETRDDIGRTTEIKDQSNVSVAAFALYGAGGRLKTQTSGNGMVGTWTYDGFRRPTDISHKTSGATERAGFEYGWDANDNPTYEERRHDSGKGDVYTYDKANRLTKVLDDCVDPSAEVGSPGSYSYTDKLEYDMDDVFNLTAYKVTPYGGSTTTTSHTANGMNEYTAIGGVTHLYTDNGALKDDNVKLYKYDAHDRLVELRDKGTNDLIAEYAYDAVGLGRRTKKVVGSDTTRYVYAGQQSVEELDGSNALLRLFVFGDRIDQVVMMEAPDQADVDNDSNTSEVVRFYHHVQLIGTVTHVTAAVQTVVESYQYDAYGKITIKDDAGSTVGSSPIGNSYTYTARQLDEESGLYYYRARQYSPALKRFIQRDPLEYVDGPNAGCYVACLPTCATDPSGCQDAKGADGKPVKAPGGGNVPVPPGNPGGGHGEDPPTRGPVIDLPGGHRITYVGWPLSSYRYGFYLSATSPGSTHTYAWVQFVSWLFTWTDSNGNSHSWSGGPELDSAAVAYPHQSSGSDAGGTSTTTAMGDAPGAGGSPPANTAANAKRVGAHIAKSANSHMKKKKGTPSGAQMPLDASPIHLHWDFTDYLIDICCQKVVCTVTWSVDLHFDANSTPPAKISGGPVSVR